jgi:hypothetical protein
MIYLETQETNIHQKHPTLAVLTFIGMIRAMAPMLGFVL